MIKNKGNLVEGEWQKVKRGGGVVLVSTNPARPSETIWSGEVSADAVDAAVEAARRAFSLWRRKSLDERSEALHRLKEQIVKHSQALAEAISEEAGKPLWEAHSEVTALRGKIDITLGEARAELTSHKLGDGSGEVRHQPHGVMAVLGPFNFPLSLSHGHIVPALLAGNTVVLKPSEQTPGVAQLYADLFVDAGFPAGVFNLVQGASTVGQRLATHPDVHGVLFTGSYGVGRQLTLSTLDQPHKILALEMGGKNATVLCPDAPYGLALYEILFSAFVTAGQRCTATSRLIVLSEGNDFIERVKADLRRLASAIVIGQPTDAKTFMGPLISEAASKKYHAATSELAKLAPNLLDEAKLPEVGHFVSPQLLMVPDDVTEHPSLKEEIFGPALAIYRARDLDQAMALANDTPYGLALSIFTADRDRFEWCLGESRAGIVNWNKGTVGATGKLPFGGIGKSGNFRPAGSYSARYCSYPVATVVGEALPKPELFPPGLPTTELVKLTAETLPA